MNSSFKISFYLVILMIGSCTGKVRNNVDMKQARVSKQIVDSLKMQGLELYKYFDYFKFEGQNSIKHTDSLSYPFIGLKDFKDSVYLNVFLKKGKTIRRIFTRINGYYVEESRIEPINVGGILEGTYTIYRNNDIVSYDYMEDLGAQEPVKVITQIRFNYPFSEIAYQLTPTLKISDSDDLDLKLNPGKIELDPLFSGYEKYETKFRYDEGKFIKEYIRPNRQSVLEIWFLNGLPSFYVEYAALLNIKHCYGDECDN